MTRLIRTTLVAGLVAVASCSFATSYTDALGDVSATMMGYGNPNIDLAGVTLSNTATTFTVTFATNSPDIQTPNWVKLNLIMRKVGDTGASVDTSATGNGWLRPYNMIGGANRFIGGWVDGGGGGQAWTFSAGAWSLTNSVVPVLAGPTATYTFNLGDLNLSVGDTLNFDAVTTGGGGGDSAWDALSSPTQTIGNPGDPFSVEGSLQYTLAAAPEPTSMVALGLGAVALLRRRRK